MLLVEGNDERFTIPELVEKAALVAWGDRERKQHPVEIFTCGGDKEVLKRKRINALLKTPNLEALGIVVDANGSVTNRWQQVRDRLLARFPTLPEAMPAAGLIETNDAGLRIGAWIMPDNQREGMLETLLCDLIRADQIPVFEHAKQATALAKTIPAPFADAHLPKAQIHSWLAWQDPPGRQLHEAIAHQVLDPSSPLAAPFVEWFIRLFELDDLRRPVAAP
ncbi:MAG: hypothetical protein L0211_19940 [Planctomycetaceae bacterium]|nr:hypothetical protein [Planctomycetaceae bacterium]